MGIVIEIAGYSFLVLCLIVLLLFVSYKIGIIEFLFQKYLQKYEQENEKELENYRSIIGLKHSTFDFALNSYIQGYQLTLQYKINSIKQLWEDILLIRKSASSSRSFYTMLYENEYKLAFENPTLKDLLDKISFEDIRNIVSIQSKNETNRVFLGEDIWSLFEVYVILMARPIVLLINSKENKQIVPIKQDTHLKSFLEIVFTKEENEKFYQEDREFLNETSITLEQKILLQMSLVLSGEKASENSIEKSRQILEKLAEYKIYVN